MTDEKLKAALAALDAACAAEDAPPEPPQAVVAARFGAPLREAPAPVEADETATDLSDFHAGLDAFRKAEKARRGHMA